MLEDYIQNSLPLVEAFLRDNFYFNNYEIMSTHELVNFINLLKSCSNEKFNVILMNLHNRLNSVQRYTNDIPF